MVLNNNIVNELKEEMGERNAYVILYLVSYLLKEQQKIMIDLKVIGRKV